MEVGVFSRPYLEGEVPSEELAGTPFEQGQLQPLTFAGYDIRVDLKNDVQTSESYRVGIEVPMLPVSRDRERKWRIFRTGAYCISIRLKSEPAEGTFIPTNVILEVDAVVHVATQASYVRFGDARVPYHAVAKGEGVRLESGMSEYFDICFDVERPEPSREISVHLSGALVLGEARRVPVMRFRETEYRYLY